MKSACFILIFLAALQFESSKAAIEWKRNGTTIWSKGCDFNGNNIKSVIAPSNECSQKCQETPKCTHYAWTIHFGSRCWLKSGPVTRDKAIAKEGDRMCGINIEGDYKVQKGRLIFDAEMNNLNEVNANWTQEIGGHGWGNNELQFYTNNNSNLIINQGTLTIQARKEKRDNNDYTSARLKSKHSFKYGVFEMRAKLPKGRGTWPAFWLLAAKRPLIWPRDGEIDIMEHVGYDMNVVHATIHSWAFNHIIGTQIGTKLVVDDVVNKYHVYQVEWTAKSITAYIDGQYFFRYEKPENAGIDKWPFDKEFNMILNLAVGGNWGAIQGVDPNIWPQNYIIDYVKVYENA